MPKHNNLSIYPFNTNFNLNDGFLCYSENDYRRTKNGRLGDLIGYLIQVIGIVIGNQNISGDIIWLQDRDYLVSDLAYVLSNNFIVVPDTIITVSEADPNFPRIDVVYADVDGNILIKEGIPSPNPVKPLLDTGTQKYVSFILIDEGQALPNGVSEIIIYKENLETEWANSSTGTINIDFNDITDPYEDTKSISVKGQQGDTQIIFASDTPLNYDSSVNLHFYIKFNPNSEQENIDSIKLILRSDNDLDSGGVIISDGDYNLDFSYTDDYQSVIIPLSTMPGLTVFSELIFEFTEALASSFLLDNIRLVTNNETIALSGSYLGLTDTIDLDYIGKDGYIPTVVNENLLLVKPYWIRIEGFDADVHKIDGNIDYTNIEDGDIVRSAVFIDGFLSYLMPYGTYRASLGVNTSRYSYIRPIILT